MPRSSRASSACRASSVPSTARRRLQDGDEVTVSCAEGLGGARLRRRVAVHDRARGRVERARHADPGDVDRRRSRPRVRAVGDAERRRGSGADRVHRHQPDRDSSNGAGALSAACGCGGREGHRRQDRVGGRDGVLRAPVQRRRGAHRRGVLPKARHCPDERFQDERVRANCSAAASSSRRKRTR